MGLLVGIHVLLLINLGIIHSDRNRFWFFSFYFICILSFVYLSFCFILLKEEKFHLFSVYACKHVCISEWLCNFLWERSFCMEWGTRQRNDLNLILQKKKWLRLNCKFLMTFSKTFPVIWSFSPYPTSHYPQPLGPACSARLNLREYSDGYSNGQVSPWGSNGKVKVDSQESTKMI